MGFTKHDGGFDITPDAVSLTHRGNLPRAASLIFVMSSLSSGGSGVGGSGGKSDFEESVCASEREWREFVCHAALPVAVSSSV